jgi:hypothetical protein
MNFFIRMRSNFHWNLAKVILVAKNTVGEYARAIVFHCTPNPLSPTALKRSNLYANCEP